MSIRVDWNRSIYERFPTTPGECCYCHKPLPKRRTRYCSDKCGHAAYIEHNVARGNPAVIRDELFKRDHGICARCGFDSEKGKREWLNRHRAGLHLVPRFKPWEAHHKVPVCEGGGVTDGKDMKLEDFETLCVECHKKETKAMHRRRAGKCSVIDQTPLLL